MAFEIITTAEMRAIDAACPVAGVPTRTLMRHAGEAVAIAIQKRFKPGGVAVLCGPGNNGGDGFVAAERLAAAGWPVEVYGLLPREQLTGDAGAAASAWAGPFALIGPETPTADIYVDALFGAGLSRPLDGHAARLARDLRDATVVAIDVPSGVDGDRGAPLGECFRAALTVTFVRKKRAHVLMPARALCGEIVLADIGAPDAVVDALKLTLWENSPKLWSFPWPSPEAHKHARGNVIVASGGHARTGAARLAARAALRVGAGLVTVLSPQDAMAENAAQLTAIMLREARDKQDYAQAAVDADAIIIGPAFGLGDAHRALLQAVLEAPKRCALILDADALTLLAPLSRTLDPRDVLTPHMGEFNRCFPDLLAREPTRIDSALQAAKRVDATVLLKGPDTVIASPDGRAIINTTGTPFLATAGSGDVLAGLLGGLIGQGMESFEAAACGAWLHGKVAELVGPGLIAEDLPELLPKILKQMGSVDK